MKKVGLDPFDKETNRKIRREVTTISTLVHKNIVRRETLARSGVGCHHSRIRCAEKRRVRLRIRCACEELVFVFQRPRTGVKFTSVPFYGC